MKTKIILICIVVFSFSFTLLNAQTIWRGPKITFTKNNGADHTLAANQDKITDNVSITRKNTSSLFNTIKETTAGRANDVPNPAPADTEWAYGTTENYTSLTYKSLPDLRNTNFSSIVDGRNMVLHLITDDIYIDIKFLSWISTDGDSSLNLGGFSYERSTPNVLTIAANALLQGPYNSTTGLMSDDLRTGGGGDRIPLTSPYNDGATVTDTGIFDNTDDDDDIVDWVQVELRDSSDITQVLTTASALIQRDGDIVAPDGTSDVTINGTGGDYYVSVNHRNHIAVVTATALRLSATATAIDFTVVANVTGGTNAMAEVSSGKYALFAGDADGNNQVQTGDYNVTTTLIGQSGYFGSDTDMNGEVQITDLNLFIARAIGNGIQF